MTFLVKMEFCYKSVLLWEASYTFAAPVFSTKDAWDCYSGVQTKKKVIIKLNITFVHPVV